MNKESLTSHSIDHVAIIMDGNGRWAKFRSRPRFWGHIRGSKVVSNIVQSADDAGVKSLTLYAFSTENWGRPLEEIKLLFRLLKKFLVIEKNRIIANNVKFKVIGEIGKLPSETLSLIRDLESETSGNTGLNLNFAFGYGSRDEIVRSANEFIKNNPGKPLTQSAIESGLFLPECGNVDLLIRTGGDYRISNFLLWQSAYAELYFTNTMWPDFSSNEFLQILNEVAMRERRFGGIGKNSNLDTSFTNAFKNKKIYEQEKGI